MTTLGNPEQKLFLQWQPSDDVDGVYENGNRLAESMHTPQREGERQRLQRLVILWKKLIAGVQEEQWADLSILEALCGGHCLASVAEIVKAIKHEQSEQEDKPAAGRANRLLLLTSLSPLYFSRPSARMVASGHTERAI